MSSDIKDRIMEIQDIVKKEDQKYKGIYNYSSEELDEHRSRYTLRERSLLIKSFDELNDYDRIAKRNLYQRIINERENPEYLAKRNNRILKIMKKGYDNDLKKLLVQGEKYDSLKNIVITNDAFNKANTLSKHLVNVSGYANEVYMHLLDYKDSEEPTIIRDLYIPYQSVTSSECKLKGGMLKRKDRENINDLNMRIIGWGHSHGYFPPFFSGTDHSNISIIPRMHGTKKVIELDTFSKENPRKFNLYYLPCIVVNARDDKPALGIAIEYYDFDHESHIYFNDSPGLKFVDSDDNIEISEEYLNREIFEKVECSSGFKKDFVHKMNAILEDDVVTENIIEGCESFESKQESLQSEKSIKDNYVLMDDYLILNEKFNQMVKRVNDLEEKINRIENDYFPISMIRLFNPGKWFQK